MSKLTKPYLSVVNNAANATKEEVARSALSWWFPYVRRSGVAFPRTSIVPFTNFEMNGLREHGLTDGSKSEATLRSYEQALTKIEKAILWHTTSNKHEFPVFLRTNFTANPGCWNKSCLLSNLEDLESHITNLYEASSEKLLTYGVAPDHWLTRLIIRDVVNVKHWAYSTKYNDFPLVQETRVFTDGYNIVCAHPKFPADQLSLFNLADAQHVFDPSVPVPFDQDEYYSTMNLDLLGLAANKILKALPVYDIHRKPIKWALDFMWTGVKWIIIGVQDAHLTWHWPKCEKHTYIQEHFQPTLTMVK